MQLRGAMKDLLDGVTAETSGTAIVVKLPITQLFVIFLLAAGLLGGVWLTTHDLGLKVDRLGRSIDKLAGTVEHIDDRVDDHEVQLKVLEDRSRRGS